MGKEGINLAKSMPLNLAEALQIFLQNTLRLIKADAAALWLISQEEQGQIEMVVSMGFDHERISKTDEERVARVILGKKMMRISDLSQDQRSLKSEFAAQSGFISYLGTPIIVKDGVAGVLEFFYRTSFPDTLVNDDLLDVISKQASVIIYTVQLLRKAHAQNSPGTTQSHRANSERSLSAIEEFVSKIAHDLNNVFTAVSGYTQLLEMNIRDVKLTEDVHRISNGVIKASTLTRNLLTFVRAQIPKRIEVSLNESLQKAIELKSDDLNSNKIRIFKDLDPSLPLTLVDPNQLQQIFLDLITYATKAMKETNNDRVLSIITREVEHNIQIRFSNDSARMHEKNPRDIHKSLFTGDENDNEARQEVLNSVELLKKQGGQIWMRSESGQWKTFIVELPILRGEGPMEIDDKPSGVSSAFNGKKGLLIDDDFQLIDLLSTCFGMEGCATEIARDGKSALEKLDCSSYDFILCDIKMPTINGIALYKQLKDKGSSCLEKIIFVTGDEISSDVQEFLKSVKNPVLFKPFNLEEVKEAVRRMITV
jgi:signal transduction histidine kinase/CheY-like chemotaxis protein